MAYTNYRNLNPKYDDTRYKVNNAIIRMMNDNPTMGLGYLIGNAIGENYFGKKRAKTSQEANDNVMNGIGADEKNGVTGVPSSAGNRGNDYYSSMNKAFDEYRNGSNGRVLFEGRSNPNAGVVVDTARGIYPRTPQQNNTSGVTVGNVDNGGGVSSVADGWNRMVNGSGYNPGNTTMFTNGTRDLGNVIGADANGVYGVPNVNPGVIVDTARGIYTGAAQQPENPGVYIDTAKGIYPGAPQDTRPAAPTPYTDDQLRQIQGQNFTAEELAKMASPDELARMVVMMRGGAPVAQAPAQGGGILTSAAERYAPATPAAPQQPANIDKIIAGDDEIYERGNPFAGQSTPLPVSHRGTRAMAAAWQQDPNIMNAASSTPVAPPQLVYPNDVDEKYYLGLLANAQHGD